MGRTAESWLFPRGQQLRRGNDERLGSRATTANSPPKLHSARLRIYTHRLHPHPGAERLARLRWSRSAAAVPLRLGTQPWGESCSGSTCRTFPQTPLVARARQLFNRPTWSILALALLMRTSAMSLADRPRDGNRDGHDPGLLVRGRRRALRGRGAQRRERCRSPLRGLHRAPRPLSPAGADGCSPRPSEGRFAGNPGPFDRAG